jgi:hypothetical protein
MEHLNMKKMDIFSEQQAYMELLQHLVYKNELLPEHQNRHKNM